MRIDRPMKKIFEAHTQRQGSAPGAFRYVLDGVRIAETDTPESLELEDGDIIDCMMEQVGGGGFLIECL